MNCGYAICLNEWLEDDTIQSELNLLLRISSLTAQTGYCFASNKYFSEKLNKTPETVSRKIAKLEKKGYIKIEYKKKGGEVISRKIKIANSRMTKMSIDDYQKCQSTIDKNVKGNITRVNITRVNKEKNNKKKKFGYYQNVLLSEEQYQKLQEKYPESYKAKIKKLDEGIELKGYKYKNHLLAILKWSEKEEKDNGRSQSDNRQVESEHSRRMREKYGDM